MAKLMLLESPNPPKEKKRKLSDLPNASEHKKQKKDKKQKITYSDAQNDDLSQSSSKVEFNSPKKEKKTKVSVVSNTPEHKKQKKDKKKKLTAITDSDVQNDDLTQNTSEDELSSSKKGKKRKLSDSEPPKTLTLVKKLKTKSTKKTKNDSTISQEAESDTNIQKSTERNVSKLTIEEAMEKYPVLKDEELVKKYLAVPMTNNQKGRIRQRLRDFFRSATSESDPDLINGKLAAILSHDALTESDLKQARILHNMLKTAVQALAEKGEPAKKPNKKKKKKSKNTEDTKNEAEADAKQEEVTSVDAEEKKSMEKAVKIKGPKRYIVFVGNLPYDADKDSIMRHFSSVVGKIRDVRIPKKGENKKAGIAYLELVDEASYQMALSRHHSMLGNRRINVLYTATGKGKVDKNEAKGKTAKLLALHKSGKLLGSTPLNRKRSARRKKQRDAEAKAQSQE